MNQCLKLVAPHQLLGNSRSIDLEWITYFVTYTAPKTVESPAAEEYPHLESQMLRQI